MQNKPIFFQPLESQELHRLFNWRKKKKKTVTARSPLARPSVFTERYLATVTICWIQAAFFSCCCRFCFFFYFFQKLFCFLFFTFLFYIFFLFFSCCLVFSRLWFIDINLFHLVGSYFFSVFTFNRVSFFAGIENVTFKQILQFWCKFRFRVSFPGALLSYLWGGVTVYYRALMHIGRYKTNQSTTLTVWLVASKLVPCFFHGYDL